MEKIKGYFPGKQSKRGRPGKSDQETLNSILWMHVQELHGEIYRKVMDPGKQCILGLQDGEMKVFPAM